MIDYIEKGKFLHKAIRDAGYFLRKSNGVWVTDNEVAVQAIIDSFDPLPDAKAEKIKELKLEGLRRANLVYDSEATVFTSIEAIKLLIDIDDTYTRDGSPAPRLVSVNALLTTYENAVATVNAMTVLASIQNYDVTINPAW